MTPSTVKMDPLDNSGRKKALENAFEILDKNLDRKLTVREVDQGVIDPSLQRHAEAIAMLKAAFAEIADLADKHDGGISLPDLEALLKLLDDDAYDRSDEGPDQSSV